MKQGPNHKKSNSLDLLREILLEEDRKKIDVLSQEVNTQEKISERITPVIDQRIDDLRNNFPEYFKAPVVEIIKIQLQESQEDLIEALYPVMGKLIKKFLVSELSKLSESINQNIKKTFSFKGFVRRMKGWFSGVSYGDDMLKDAIPSVIEEVFIIEKDSGLLIGSQSTGNIANKDMVSGMLTAIKAFAEDAFSKEGQSLENVKFETFQISLHNFKTIYIAIAVSGVFNSEFSDELNDKVTNLAEIILGDRKLLSDESKLKSLIFEHLLSN